MRTTGLVEPMIFEPAWYCARTKPKHEQLAAVSLSRQLGLAVFNPRLRVERATVRGVVRVIEPLFPCYLFVRCTQADELDDMRYITGVHSLVRFGLRTATVPDEVIMELQQCFEADEPMPVEDPLPKGAEVLVADGPFMGFNATVVRVMPAKRRVQILLDFLGRTTLAEVDRKSLIYERRCLAESAPLLAGPCLNPAAVTWAGSF
jgi:transcriptional antiterminator RfaH